MPTTAKFDVTIIYIYISDICSLLADTREPYDLILKKIGGLLKEMLKSKNLDWHERHIMGSASSRPCPKVTHNLFGSRISFQDIEKFGFCIFESVSIGIVVFVGYPRVG